MTRTVLIFLALFLLPTGGTLASPSSPVQRPVQYDATRDRLTLNAGGTSLRQLLGAIAAQSGIEVLFDPQAEETVSVTLRDAPLESALKHLLKGKSSAFTYGDTAPGKTPMLIGVRVLPRGKSDAGGLRPLLDPVAEAGWQARDGAAGGATKQARWEARLNQLSTEQRQALTTAAEQRNAAQEQRTAERRQRQAARRAEEERLQAAHPEYYAQRQQQIEENRRLRAQGIGRAKVHVEIKEK